MSQLALRLQHSVQTNSVDDLSRAVIFKCLPRDGSLDRLAELAIPHAFSAGEVLVDFGEAETSLLIFVEGKAVATRPAKPSFVDDTNIAQIHHAQRVLLCEAGDTYGETSLIEASPSEVTLTAETDGFLWKLETAAFEQFAHEFPTAAFQFQAALARRLVHQIKKAQETLRLLVGT